MSNARQLHVGRWRVESDRDRVISPDGEAQLMPKAMAVLIYLAERPGQVVSTDELVESVWHGRPMGENPVYKCVTQLRTALGDDRSSPSYIETVHTKGYRLIAPVAWLDTDESEDGSALGGTAEKAAQRRGLGRRMTWLWGLAAVSLLVVLWFAFGERGGDGAPGAPTDSPSIAVLPFVNVSADPAEEYFADGLTEELITQLANVPGLRVIGRTSSFAFKGQNEDLRSIGRELGVNHVLEGGVRKSEQRVRVTAQLIDVTDGRHLYAQAYDRPVDDLLAIQEEIAKAVASALDISISARLVRHGGTRDLEAYDAFLAGLAAAAAGGADNVLASVAAFERAVAIDSGFLVAWEALAEVLQLASIDVPGRRAEWLEKLAVAEDRIRALAPDSPSAISLAAQREMANGNLIEAERLFQLHPSRPPRYSTLYQPYGVFLLNVGRPRDAIALFTRDRDADPLALGPSLWLQIALEVAGELAQADQEYQRALGFASDTRAIRTMALIRAMSRGDEQAIRRELSAQETVTLLTRPINDAVLRHLEDPASALVEIRRQLDDPAMAGIPVVLMVLSAWAAFFGDPQLALQAMERLPLPAGNNFAWSVWRPIQSEMRSLPEFKELVREWGLPAYWRETGRWGDFCRPLGEDDLDCTSVPPSH